MTRIFNIGRQAARSLEHSGAAGTTRRKQSQSNNNCQPDITMQHYDIRLRLRAGEGAIISPAGTAAGG
jgi:hypothetical protein